MGKCVSVVCSPLRLFGEYVIFFRFFALLFVIYLLRNVSSRVLWQCIKLPYASVLFCWQCNPSLQLLVLLSDISKAWNMEQYIVASIILKWILNCCSDFNFLTSCASFAFTHTQHSHGPAFIYMLISRVMGLCCCGIEMSLFTMDGCLWLLLTNQRRAEFANHFPVVLAQSWNGFSIVINCKWKQVNC